MADVIEERNYKWHPSWKPGTVAVVVAVVVVFVDAAAIASLPIVSSIFIQMG